MVKIFVTLMLFLFVCSCTQTDKEKDVILTYYTIENDELKQQILNYIDSVNVPCDEKMLCVSCYDIECYNYTHNIQFTFGYQTSAFNPFFAHCLFAKIDTLTIAISYESAHDYFFLPDDTGWKYMKNIFKRDYDYYLKSIKTSSEIIVHPDPFGDICKCRIPLWTLIFENNKLVDRIIL